MEKIALLVEYDGSRYHGFQYQANAPTIQAEIEKALERLMGEAIRILGASRTDAGVHALGQVVSFRTKVNRPLSVWVKGLNFYLPRDIAVKAAWHLAWDFDIRKHPIAREYRYRLVNSPNPSPLWRHYAHWVSQPLDVQAMQEACQTLVGEHDFSAFSPAAAGMPGRTRRRVYWARISRKGDVVFFDIAANSFLPHQVRHTVGALLRVGLGRLRVSEFQHLAGAKVLGLAGPAVPAHGLCLTQIRYPETWMDKSNEDL